MNINAKIINKLNLAGKERKPFFFAIDFLGQEIIFRHLNELNNDIQIAFPSYSNIENYQNIQKEISFHKYPISYSQYRKSFGLAHENLKYGNSYLLNLTFPTKIKTNLKLEEIYYLSNAKYKIYIKDFFVCFSPESFIKIENNEISTYPMKGTIDASIENAQEEILRDIKEQAEHVTIVDLMRNDLSIIASKVEVKKFRYVEKISTNQLDLLQVSSEIKGILPANWHERLGDIFAALLPAGSISGAPKKKTIEIILQAENYKRGFYTGVAGIFDGKKLDSCVMIRYIEKLGDEYIYKSGGGITALSKAESEYNEMIDKVYLPI